MSITHRFSCYRSTLKRWRIKSVTIINHLYQIRPRPIGIDNRRHISSRFRIVKHQISPCLYRSPGSISSILVHIFIYNNSKSRPTRRSLCQIIITALSNPYTIKISSQPRPRHLKFENHIVVCRQYIIGDSSEVRRISQLYMNLTSSQINRSRPTSRHRRSTRRHRINSKRSACIRYKHILLYRRRCIKRQRKPCGNYRCMIQLKIINTSWLCCIRNLLIRYSCRKIPIRIFSIACRNTNKIHTLSTVSKKGIRLMRRDAL